MNILIAADYRAPHCGNFIPSLLELGLAMRENGDELFFVFPNSENARKNDSWSKWLEKNGFKVILADMDKSDSDIYDELKKNIKELNIDVLHTHFGLYHHIVLTRGKELGVKIILHDHMEFPVGCNKSKLSAKIKIKSLAYRKNGISVIGVHEEKADSYTFAKHWFVPNAISFKRWNALDESRDECRNRLGVSDDEKLCMLLGWDLNLKGADVALKAIEHLREKDKNIVFGIIGIGTDPADGNRNFIAEVAGVDPDADWIRYLPSTADMFAYHRAADIYISASRSEAFSYGLLESISQNTPVAVSDIKGTSWSWEYDKCFTFPVEDYMACADAIEKAINAGRSESNYTEIIEKYNIDKWCNRIIEIYREVLS